MSLSQNLTLADLATTVPAASRVFQRHHLDFCCRGRRTLSDACAASALDPAAIIAEIESEDPPAAADGVSVRWDLRPVEDLVAHILARYHLPLRPEIARLVDMARKVERVHAEKPACPRGLTEHLEAVAVDLESHLAKEEQVLFPLVLAGRGAGARMPVRVLMLEHEDHGASLRRTRELAHDLVPPPEACATWRALYLGLENLERELFEHIHLENNVLFPRVLAA